MRTKLHPKIPGLGERLQKAVDAWGGRSKVSTDLGIPLSTITKWCQGVYEPCLSNLCVLALYLEVSVEHLLGVKKTDGQEARRLDRFEDLRMWNRRKKARRPDLRARKAEVI